MVTTAGKSKIWALRMPGGMTKVVRSKKELTEQAAKAIYTKSFAYKTAKSLVDKELAWPLCRAMDDAELNRDYPGFLHASEVTGVNKRLVEV